MQESERNAIARMTTNGRVTVPKVVRDHLGLRPGDKVEFTERDDGSLFVKNAVPSEPPIRQARNPRSQPRS